jgi:hypothetical protein
MGKKFSRCIRPDTLGTADKEYVTATRLQGILPFSMFRSLAAALRIDAKINIVTSSFA